MRAYLRSKGQLLTPALKEIRRTRAQRLLQWDAENGHENILFTDEEFFTIEEQYNNQNNKIYAQTFLEVHSKGARMPSPFLRHGLVGGVPSGGDTSFLQERGETGVRVYQEDVLQGVVKQINLTFFSGQEWVFQQDSVPGQKLRRLRSGCGRTFRSLSALRIGPRGGPDLKSQDYKLWAVLEEMACQKRHKNLDSLKRSLVKAATENPWRRCVPR